MTYRVRYPARPRWINFYSVVLTVVALLCAVIVYLLHSGFALPFGNLLFPLEHASTQVWTPPRAEVPGFTVVSAPRVVPVSATQAVARSTSGTQHRVYPTKAPVVSAPSPRATTTPDPKPVSTPTPSSRTVVDAVSQSASAVLSSAPPTTPLRQVAGSVNQEVQGLLGAAGVLPLP